MIIDSHVHYAHKVYDTEGPCLCGLDKTYTVRRVERETLLTLLRENGIVGVIEPSIGFDAIGKQMDTVSVHSDFMWAAIGIHPTRCTRTAWRHRRDLKRYAVTHDIVAIGETGLDYHEKSFTAKQGRIQRRWFRYQLKLAHRMRLPMILHIRKADGDALKMLKKYRRYLHGGVVHCFGGDHNRAMDYIALGYAIGIGGALLDDDETGRALCDTVKNVPLSSLLVETDAPFVYPERGKAECDTTPSQKKKLRNSSLILPMVVERIAELRGEPRALVEEALYRNTLRVFGLKEPPVSQTE